MQLTFTRNMEINIHLSSKKKSGISYLGIVDNRKFETYYLETILICIKH